MNVRSLRNATAGMAAMAALLMSTALDAQTLRMAFSAEIEGLDEVYDPKPDTTFTGTVVYDMLARFHPETGEYSGMLADEIEQIDDMTWRMTLREDVTWHDGERFTADDVVYTLSFMSSPEARFPSRTRWDFIEQVEKVNDFEVIIHLNEPYSPFLARMATGTPMYPAHVHGALENTATWGRAPIGTGPYRAVSVDSERGIVLERFEDYVVGPMPDFERIEIRQIPDAQTQIAELLTGGIDIFAAPNRSTIQAAEGLPGINMSVGEDLSHIYMIFDAAGRSGHPAMGDIRVRQAILHAMDRDQLRRSLSRGGEESLALDRTCFPQQAVCPDGANPPAFDQDRARSLLAEAGYADGFDLTIHTLPPTQEMAQAVAGYLRQVGIRASIETLSIPAYRAARADGAMAMQTAFWTHGGMPDAGYALKFYFGVPSQDYSGNPRLRELSDIANQTSGEERMALVREAYDLMQDEALVLPVTGNPIVFLHNDSVRIDRTDRGGLFNTFGVSITNLAAGN